MASSVCLELLLQTQLVSLFKSTLAQMPSTIEKTELLWLWCCERRPEVLPAGMGHLPQTLGAPYSPGLAQPATFLSHSPEPLVYST